MQRTRGRGRETTAKAQTSLDSSGVAVVLHQNLVMQLMRDVGLTVNLAFFDLIQGFAVHALSCSGSRL